jgi:hypothetical protein
MMASSTIGLKAEEEIKIVRGGGRGVNFSDINTRLASRAVVSLWLGGGGPC